MGEPVRFPSVKGATTLAFWLVPAEPQRAFLSSVIRILAEQLHAPQFEPHVTVFTTESSDCDPPEVLKSVRAKPIELRISGIDCSERYTKTLFVQFEQNRALQKLSRALYGACGGRSDYKLDPHLSLVYKQLPDEMKEALAYGTAIPFEEVRFNVLRAVLSPSPITSAEDVDAWQVVASRDLE